MEYNSQLYSFLSFFFPSQFLYLDNGISMRENFDHHNIIHVHLLLLFRKNASIFFVFIVSESGINIIKCIFFFVYSFCRGCARLVHVWSYSYIVTRLCWLTWHTIQIQRFNVIALPADFRCEWHFQEHLLGEKRGWLVVRNKYMYYALILLAIHDSTKL